MASFANMDIASVNKQGVLAFESSSVATELTASIAAKDAEVVNSALSTFKSLCEGIDQWIEPYLVEALPAILDALADKKTAESATAAGTAILAKSQKHAPRPPVKGIWLRPAFGYVACLRNALVCVQPHTALQCLWKSVKPCSAQQA